MKKLPICLAVILLSPLSGSASELGQRVQVLERRVQALSDLVLRVDSLQREVQQLRGELELQNHAMEALKKRQRDLYLDIDNRLAQPGGNMVVPQSGRSPQSAEQPPPLEMRADDGQRRAPAPTPKAAPLQAKLASGKEERDYQKAFQMLTQRRYDEARSSFQVFLKAYPQGPYADNAQYWLGEASYVTRDFDTALKEFTRVLEQYPESSKVSGAMLKIGYIQYEKQLPDKARTTLDSLIRRFPGSSAARLAQEFINKNKI